VTDYSQSGEQAVILEHVGDRKRGRFLDIGAYDAVTFSNVRALFERGWTGVLVEPNATHADRLRTQYPVDTGVVVVEAAVGVLPGTGEMRATDDATSTLHPPTYEKWRGDVVYHPGVVMVNVVSLESIYLMFGAFDVVSIDAEGWSVPILDRLVALGHRPDVIVVEHDNRLRQVGMIAAQGGYARAAINAQNAILVRT